MEQSVPLLAPSTNLILSQAVTLNKSTVKHSQNIFFMSIRVYSVTVSRRPATQVITVVQHGLKRKDNQRELSNKINSETRAFFCLSRGMCETQ